MVLYRWISAPCSERPGYEASEYMKALNGEEVVGRGTSSKSKVCFFKGENLCITEEDLATIAEEYGLPPTAETVMEHRDIFLKSAHKVLHNQIDDVIDGIAEKHALLRFDIPDDIFENMKSSGKIKESCARYSGDPLGTQLMYVMDEVQMDGYDKELQQYMTIVGESKIPGRRYTDLLSLRDSANIVAFDKKNKILFLTTDDSSQSKVYDFGQPDFPELTVAPGEFFHKGAVFYDGEYNGTRGFQPKYNRYISYLNIQAPSPQNSPISHRAEAIDVITDKIMSIRALHQLNVKAFANLNAINNSATLQMGDAKVRKTISKLYDKLLHQSVPDKVMEYYELRKGQALFRNSYPDIEISRAMMFVDGVAYIKTPDSLSIWKSEQGEFLNTEELMKKIENAKSVLFLPQLSAEPQTIGEKEINAIKNNMKFIDARNAISLVNDIICDAYKLSPPKDLEEIIGSGHVQFGLDLKQNGDYSFRPEMIWKVDRYSIRNILITFNDDMTTAYVSKNSPTSCEKIEIPQKDLSSTCKAINEWISEIKSVNEKDEEKKADILIDMFDDCTLDDIFVFAAAKNMQSITREEAREMA